LQGYGSIFEVARIFDPRFIVPFFYFVLLFPMAVLWTAYLLKKPWKKQPRNKAAGHS